MAPSLDLLQSRHPHVMKLDLAPVRALLGQMGNPQDAYVCVHVAGTNGKGSVSAMVASILQRAGYKTGLYTSPHLVRFNERIRINGEPISDADLAALLPAIDQKAKALAREPGGRDVTFFEFTTAAAFQHFRNCGVDIAVLETGLGGRLDATNVAIPAVSVITSIGIDHAQVLGNTIEDIAGEKAGIIKANRPVICGPLPQEAMGVVERAAAAQAAPLVRAAERVSVRRLKQTLQGQRLKIESAAHSYKPAMLPLLGRQQLENVATVVAAVECLRGMKIAIADEALVAGLENVQWRACFQVLATDPVLVLDGAHNPAAAKALGQTCREVFKGQAIGLIAGFLSDKDAKGFLRQLKKDVSRCWIVPVNSDRAMPQDQALAAARGAGLRPEAADLAAALEQARTWARAENAVIVVAGSLYLAGEVLQRQGP
jgi:dihydrofolate synthase/folylpolyglutamate synthase